MTSSGSCASTVVRCSCSEHALSSSADDASRESPWRFLAAGFSGDVAFVAIKNVGTTDNGIGYFIDTHGVAGTASFPLKDLPQLICRAFGTEWEPPAEQVA